MFSKWSFTCHSDGKWIMFDRHRIRRWFTVESVVHRRPFVGICALAATHFWTLLVLKLFMCHVSTLQISIQTDPVKSAPPPPGPKILKNKALLCRPLVQNKGVSCRTQTADCEVQTGKINTHTFKNSTVFILLSFVRSYNNNNYINQNNNSDCVIQWHYETKKYHTFATPPSKKVYYEFKIYVKKC